MDISIDQIRDVVTNWADSHHDIKRVFLFGSRARGDSTPDSDVDLAVEVVGISGENADTRYFFNVNTWKKQLGAALGRSINIVRLIDHGKPEIQESIDRDGVVLYERPSE
jgi:predicted nucleotidyltransferase